MGKAKTKSELEKLSFKLGTVFKPTSPINREDLFAGRIQQVLEVVDVINQDGQHAALYGERGVGKTSLANMMFLKMRHTAMPKLAPIVNCINSDDFTAIWKRVFLKIEYIAKNDDLDLPERVNEIFREYLDPFVETMSPDIVQQVLHELGQFYLVIIVIDEFDSLLSKQTKKTIADMIKFLSDSNTPATVVLIGVAEDVGTLIDNHQSIERCLCQIFLPRMSRDDLEQIVKTGLAECEMQIDPAPLHEISRLSRGLPHYTHLLTLFAGRCALADSRLMVTKADVAVAVKQSIGKAQASIEDSYIRAITSSRAEALYKQVLLAAAMAETDSTGYFYPKDIRPHLERIVKRAVKFDTFNKQLQAFCEEQRGGVMRKDDSTARPRYRFDNPLLEPYIVIRGLADGIITEEDLHETRDIRDPQKRLF